MDTQDEDPTQINVTKVPTTTNGGGGGGALKGAPPKYFDGTRSDSQTFMDDFILYWKINRANDTMKEAYSRDLMAISFIKGPNVRDWARAQVEELEYKIDPVGRNMQPAEETIWKEFKRNFLDAFTDTTSKQDAYLKVKNLKMNNDDLDSYIATHRNLVLRAGWDQDGEAALESFKNGLKQQLHLAIIRHDNTPNSLDEWRTAARKEQGKWALIKASGLIGNRGNQSGNRQNQWKQAFGNKGGQGKPKDPNAMDVDNTQLIPLTDEERKKLSAEGRCFRCRQQGHMSRACPKRQNQGQGTNNQQNISRTSSPRTNARVKEVVDDRDDSSETGSTTTAVSTKSTKINVVKMAPNDVVLALEKMSKEQRDEVLDQIILRGEEF
jgi:hypothetical protein